MANITPAFPYMCTLLKYIRTQNPELFRALNFIYKNEQITPVFMESLVERTGVEAFAENVLAPMVDCFIQHPSVEEKYYDEPQAEKKDNSERTAYGNFKQRCYWMTFDGLGQYIESVLAADSEKIQTYSTRQHRCVSQLEDSNTVLSAALFLYAAKNTEIVKTWGAKSSSKEHFRPDKHEYKVYRLDERVSAFSPNKMFCECGLFCDSLGYRETLLEEESQVLSSITDGLEFCKYVEALSEKYAISKITLSSQYHAPSRMVYVTAVFGPSFGLDNTYICNCSVGRMSPWHPDSFLSGFESQLSELKIDFVNAHNLPFESFLTTDECISICLKHDIIFDPEMYFVPRDTADIHAYVTENSILDQALQALNIKTVTEAAQNCTPFELINAITAAGYSYSTADKITTDFARALLRLGSSFLCILNPYWKKIIACIIAQASES